jgi:hypothetical protein
MNPYDDDLAPFADNPVVRALTGPAAPDELTGEAEALAAFRAAGVGAVRSGRSRARHTAAVRWGMGAGTFVVAIALSGGVAAAYTSSLPEPLQRVANALLGPVGVPAPKPQARSAAGGTRHQHRHGGNPAQAAGTGTGGGGLLTGAGAGAGSRSPAPQPSQPAAGRGRPPASGSAAPGVTPRPSASPTAVAPTQSPTPGPSASPTPTPTPVQADPSTWTLSESLNRSVVPFGKGDTIHATLVDGSGQPVANHRVAVWDHPVGDSQWTRLGVRKTASDGTVQLFFGNLTQDVKVVVRAGNGVHGQPLLVAVKPAISTSVAPSQDGSQDVVQVSTRGGVAGDTVALFRHKPGGGWTQIGTGQLDGSGGVSFAVPRPKHGKVRYAVRLKPTQHHNAAWATFLATA